MSETPDLRKFLDSWPYDPDNNVRLARGADEREIMLVRQPLGLEEYEVQGRPDGQRPHESESVLEFQYARLAAARNAGAESALKLTAADCADLFDEGTIYYHRLIHFFRLKNWLRAERDSARNLQLLDFVKGYAEHEEDRIQLEQWRPYISRINAVARAMILLEKGQYEESLKIARDSIEGPKGVDEHPKGPRELAEALLQESRESLVIRPAFRPREESAYVLRGDYWTIRYQGQIARLKTTRGLHCLACLLRHPGREFHVSELIVDLIQVPVLAETRIAGHEESVLEVTTAHSKGPGPILDARAKAEYKRRLHDLREDLDEAAQFSDRERAAKVQEEMDSISEQLAMAIGLGGRKRQAGSDAERARSAVTKRIKESINRISGPVPALGRHLAARIKTGFFCSYNPHPDRPVAWKFC